MSKSEIFPCVPRQDVQVRFADGSILCGPVGRPLADFIQALPTPGDLPALAGVIGGRLVELSDPILGDSDVSLITVNDEAGRRIYEASLTLLLAAATGELFPEAAITVDHALTFGGLFFRVLNRPPFTEGELRAIEERMRAMVAQDLPIGRQEISTSAARALASQNGDESRVRLLRNHQGYVVSLRTLAGAQEYFYGPLVPSTGYLTVFAVRPYPPGFVLQTPEPGKRMSLGRLQHYPKITQVFQEYGRWLNLLGVPDVGALNQALAEGRDREIVLVAEALHSQEIAEIAAEIARQRGQIRVVLIAGPSSSGKTTFSRRLTVQLLANGLRPFPIGLDDYFLDRDKSPRGPDGNYDFEALEAIDLERLNHDFAHLLAGEEVTLPRYNFQTGRQETGPTVRLTAGHVILVEGIHSLNPRLVTQVPPEMVYRIYASPLTQLKLDRLNRVATTDTRLVRRIVRDARDRGYTAQETINHWPSVRRGEARHIFPYQEHADVIFNSALVYELAVLRPLAEPLLRQVPAGTREYIEAQRLLNFLSWFEPWDVSLVPEVSILREFAGGSFITNFLPHL